MYWKDLKKSCNLSLVLTNRGCSWPAAVAGREGSAGIQTAAPGSGFPQWGISPSEWKHLLSIPCCREQSAAKALIAPPWASWSRCPECLKEQQLGKKRHLSSFWAYIKIYYRYFQTGLQPRLQYLLKVQAVPVFILPFLTQFLPVTGWKYTVWHLTPRITVGRRGRTRQCSPSGIHAAPGCTAAAWSLLGKSFVINPSWWRGGHRFPTGISTAL